MIGTMLRGLRWGKSQLGEQAKMRAVEIEAVAGERRGEVVEDVEAAIETVRSGKKAQ